jgi:hypothetical protein
MIPNIAKLVKRRVKVSWSIPRCNTATVSQPHKYVEDLEVENYMYM